MCRWIRWWHDKVTIPVDEAQNVPCEGSFRALNGTCTGYLVTVCKTSPGFLLLFSFKQLYGTSTCSAQCVIFWKSLLLGKVTNVSIIGCKWNYGEGMSTCLWVKIQRNLFSGRIRRSTKHEMVNFVLQVWSEATFSYLLAQNFFQKCAATLKREKSDLI